MPQSRTNSLKDSTSIVNHQQSQLELTRLSAESENTNLVNVEGLIITETNTQTESISEMTPKFWILQEHLHNIRDDPEVLDPPRALIFRLYIACKLYISMSQKQAYVSHSNLWS